MAKKDKDMIKFSGRHHPKLGIASTIIGIFVWIGFIASTVISVMNQGNGGLVIGIIGLAIFFLSIYGFYISYQSFKKKDIFYIYPILGAFFNGFMLIFLLIIYILGFGG